VDGHASHVGSWRSSHSVGRRTISGVEAQAAVEPIGAFIYTRPLDEIQ